MGQKANPIGLRIGIIRDWDSRWFSARRYSQFVLEDERMRQFIRNRFSRSAGDVGRSSDRVRDVGLSRIEIERAANTVRLTLHTAKPGLIIGRGGRGVEELRGELEHQTGKRVHVNVMEVKEPELDAQLVGESIAGQIERRVAYKRAMRQAILRTMKARAKGIKIIVSGRLGGGEISRRYTDKDGKVPLHTLRSDIDYGFAQARTTYGNTGVKVWIYRGDIMPPPRQPPPRPEAKEPAERKVPAVRRIPRVETRSEEGEPVGEPAPGKPATEHVDAGEPQARPTSGAQKRDEGVAADADAGES
jgi:small subunit ribosomal protein S3